MIWTGEAIPPRASCPRRDLFLIREQLWRSSAGAAVKILETRHPSPTDSSSGVGDQNNAGRDKRDEPDLPRDMFRPPFSRWTGGSNKRMSSGASSGLAETRSRYPRVSAPHVGPPRDPAPSPQALHPHGPGGLSPQNKGMGVTVENRQANIPLSMERVAAGSIGTL